MSKQFELLSTSQSPQVEVGRSTRTYRSRPQVRPISNPTTSSSSGAAIIVSSRWCESGAKRAFDFCAAALLLVLVSPLLFLLCVAIRATSYGPAIFRQRRVGQHGVDFTIYKLRTMRHWSVGPQRSSHADHRLTSLGSWLRKYKLDELPQLMNVILGQMSLVGPRPKLRGHHSVDIRYRPGITGAATLAFAGEERLVRDVHPELLEDCHREVINPRKLQLDLEYMAAATFFSDIHLLWFTILGRGRCTDMEELDAWRRSDQVAWSFGRQRGNCS